MSKEDLEHFRQLLEEKKAEILKDMGTIEEQTSTTASESSGELSYSDHMPELGSDANEREKAFMFASRDESYLSQIEAALKRLEDGTFGICRVCGKEIPKERMEAVPTTTICVACKSIENEQKRKIV